ncbi:hypothetical protein BGZ58_006903 [Dissophora ornata]|nr:hypothetical protein BGZ58_006903 [Dissophora ornata]
MTNTTEIETTTTTTTEVVATEVVATEHKATDGHPKSFAEGAFEVADHPFFPQPTQGIGMYSPSTPGMGNIVGVPHHEAHGHEHRTVQKPDHPDAFHDFGDRIVGHDLHSAEAIHHRPTK